MGLRELDYDTIGWDADGDGKIHWTEQHFIGSHFVCDGRVFQFIQACTMIEDKLLILRFKQGNHEALRQIYDKYKLREYIFR